jgi:hypothetical protein
VQETLTTIKEDLGIKSNLHEDGRVILNYDMIESPKLNGLARECRGLVLDTNNNWALVARAFTRFFNLGEHRPEQDGFIWPGSIATDKEDGSLILVYHWKGEWHVNTRGSFGDGLVGDSIFTWRDLLVMAMGDDWTDGLDPSITYVGEICSMYNKVVRTYKKPVFFLLSAFWGEIELDHEQILDIGICHAQDRDENQVGSFVVPFLHIFNSEREVEKFIEKSGTDDPTFEGIVLRDVNNMRIKVKTPEYVALHRMSNNGNLASPKNLIPFILKGEEDEVLLYFPELTDWVAEVKAKMDAAYQEMDNYWYCHHDEKNRKKFALAVLPCRFSSILFTAKDKGISPLEIWRDSPEFIFKVLFKDAKR